MEKGAIIHEPLVPRTFRLLAESEKEGNGLVTYGLKDPNDNTFTFWNGSILLDDGRFYELQLECDQNYPQKPPKVKFISNSFCRSIRMDKTKFFKFFKKLE